MIFLRLFNEKINSLQGFVFYLKLPKIWFYVVSFAFIIDYILYPCAYISFAIDNINILMQCKTTDSNNFEPKIYFEETLIGMAYFILVVGLVLYQHFNKLKYPAWITLILYIVLLVTFLVGVILPT